MEGFKGTPGPWTAVEKYADEPLNVVDSNGFKVVSAERFAILDGWDEQGFPHWGEDGGHRELPAEECVANSRLIAAAPELLEALQLFAGEEIMAQLNGSEFVEPTDDEEWVRFRFVAKDFRKAAAAIKKALGQ